MPRKWYGMLHIPFDSLSGLRPPPPPVINCRGDGPLVLTSDLACLRFSRQVLSIFFCLYSPRTLYILENILEYRGYFCHSAGRRGQKVAPNIRLCLRNRPGTLKTQRFQLASTQNLLLRGKRAVPRSSSQDRSRRRDCSVENVQEYLETRGQLRSRAERPSITVI